MPVRLASYNSGIRMLEKSDAISNLLVFSRNGDGFVFSCISGTQFKKTHFAMLLVFRENDSTIPEDRLQH